VLDRAYKGPPCSAARALEIVGERWSLLIIRDALFPGTTRFSDFQRDLGIAPNVLAARLSRFVEVGLMQLHRYSDHPEHHEYLLTEKGRALGPVVIALAYWGDNWAGADGSPFILEHKGCGGIVNGEIGCATCGQTPTQEQVQRRSRPGTEIARALRVVHPDDESPTRSVPSPIEISLLGTFTVRVGGKTLENLSAGSQRLLAFLALHDRSVSRIATAGTLWPESSDQGAGSSLRSALSRLDAPSREAVWLASAGLRLAENVIVDLRQSQALAQRLLQPGGSPENSDLSPAAISALSQDLLPDWYDDWVITEAEDWRQLRLNGLEALAQHLILRGRLPEAAGAARAAMKAEPLRESAHTCLIRVHLAEGNQSEALRAFSRYRKLLRAELDLEPTPQLSDLVAGIKNPANTPSH
jgi:DNA-binding HxlR family transcriptional regulator/DNA-binding SARP family transcriptional activator